MHLTGKNNVLGGLLIVALALPLGFACGEETRRAELSDLKSQIAELNRKVTDSSVRIEDLGNRLYILEDRLESARLSSGKESPPNDLRLVKLVPKDGKTPPGGEKAPLLTFSSSSDTNGGGEARYQAALALVRAKKYAEAIEALEPFRAGRAAAEWVDNGVFWTGVCLFELGRYGEAAAEFERVRRIKGTNKEADALVYLGRCREASSDAAGARALYDEVIKRFPASEITSKAREALGRLNGGS